MNAVILLSSFLAYVAASEHYGGYAYHGPLAAPVVLKSGYLADTHDVAAAKSAQLAALDKAHSHGGYADGGYAGGYSDGGYAGGYSDGGYAGGYGHGGYAYHGPLAAPVVLKSGYLADTHDVATAKSAHLAALDKAHSHGGYADGGYTGGYSDGGYAGGHSDGGYVGGYGHGGYAYHGPLAAPVVLKSGYLADTHDVAAAKGAHLVALEKAHSHGGYADGGYAGGYSDGGYAGGHSDGGYTGGYGHAGYAYHGPLAAPVVLKSGYLADTHDVAAAKGAHLVALEKAHSHGGYGDGGYAGGYADGGYAGGYGDAGYSGGHGDGGHGYGGYAYHGPLAAPVVLKSGYLADTHDVAAAKGAHLVALEKAHSHGGHHY